MGVRRLSKLDIYAKFSSLQKLIAAVPPLHLFVCSSLSGRKWRGSTITACAPWPGPQLIYVHTQYSIITIAKTAFIEVIIHIVYTFRFFITCTVYKNCTREWERSRQAKSHEVFIPLLKKVLFWGEASYSFRRESLLQSTCSQKLTLTFIM
jgi:hypothetical protein